MARRMLLAVGACAAFVAALRVARRAFLAVEVAGESMLPTLRPGEFILLRRGLPAGAAGRIAFVRGPDGRPLLKRIIGLPGESVRVGDHVELNGHELAEDYVLGTSPAADFRGVNQLGPHEVFLLGDNRVASTDSRHFGPLPVSRVEAVAWVRYWPPGRVGRIARPRRRFRAPTPARSGATPTLEGA